MNRRENTPPSLAAKLLKAFLYYEDEFCIADTLHDLYDYKRKTYGKRKADFWYWKQVLVSIPKSHYNGFVWRLAMLKNYIKITIRNLKNHKGYSFINISGLALGMACFIIILFWVHDELNFDQFHKHKDYLYRVIEQQTYEDHTNHVAATPAALAPALSIEIPEVANAMRLFRAPSLLLNHHSKRFYEDGIVFTSPSILEMFTFPLIEGEPKSALQNISSIVITEEMAEKYFGDENPMNKTLTINNQQDFLVTGIIQNIPKNSHIKFDILLPFKALEALWADVGIRWRNILENWGINC